MRPDRVAPLWRGRVEFPRGRRCNSPPVLALFSSIAAIRCRDRGLSSQTAEPTR